MSPSTSTPWTPAEQALLDIARGHYCSGSCTAYLTALATLRKLHPDRWEEICREVSAAQPESKAGDDAGMLRAISTLIDEDVVRVARLAERDEMAGHDARCEQFLAALDDRFLRRT